MGKQLFPSCRYKDGEPPVIIQTQAESDALGPGWTNSPCPITPPVLWDPEPGLKRYRHVVIAGVPEAVPPPVAVLPVEPAKKSWKKPAAKR